MSNTDAIIIIIITLSQLLKSAWYIACKPKIRAHIVRKFGSIQTTEKRLGLDWRAFLANLMLLFFI
jgi:hypothetical protein